MPAEQPKFPMMKLMQSSFGITYHDPGCFGDSLWDTAAQLEAARRLSKAPGTRAEGPFAS